jgi:hypothetical protein
MKAIGKSSLSSVLKVALDVMWYLALVAIVIGLGVMVYSLVTEGNVGGYMMLPVVLDIDHSVYSITAARMGINEIRLDCVEAHMKFDSPGSGFLLFFGLHMAVGLAIVLLVLYQLRKIFATLTAGSPFVSANAARIRLIGWIVIIGELVEEILQTVGQRIVIASFETQGVTFRWDIDLSLSTIMWGFVLLVLAEVFRLGVQMREDQELTV